MFSLKKFLTKGAPSLLVPFGVCIILASTKDLRAALGMSLAVLVTLVLSSLVITLIKGIVPEKVKLVVNLIVVTGFAVLVQMLMKAFVSSLFDQVGMELACVALSLGVFRTNKQVEGLEKEPTSVLTCVACALYFACLMIVTSVVREFLGNGSIFGVAIGFMENVKVSAFVSAYGAYIVLAIVLAVINAICNKCDKEAM